MKKTIQLANSIAEVTPLSENDCIYIVDRKKNEFTYPLHRHDEFELNFVENASGCIRLVGDSIETIGNYDLVLITGENLEHTWQQGTCESDEIREVTIQFSRNLFASELLQRNQFNSIKRMFLDAQCGLVFPMSAIMSVYSKLDKLCELTDSFLQYIHFVEILYELSLCTSACKLSNSSFVHVEQHSDSRRISKVVEYINNHLVDKITLNELSQIAGMTPMAFSRFFKVRTGKSIVDFILDQRLGIASRLLVDSTKSIVEICYESGFNNVSNFNRIFKKRKNMTPKEFRTTYRKKVVLF